MLDANYPPPTKCWRKAPEAMSKGYWAHTCPGDRGIWS